MTGPSSTSSSEVLAPAGRWGLAWLAGLLVAACALGAIEALWRTAGFETSVTDDKDLWATERLGADRGAGRTLALIGSSRALTGLVPSAMAQALPGHDVINAGINGQHPLAVLEDLGDDTEFLGVVICDVTAESFGKGASHHGEDWVAHARDLTIQRHLDRRVRTLLQGNLVLLHPELSARKLAREYAEDGRLPLPSFVSVQPDRWNRGDYGLRDVSALIQKWRDPYEKSRPPAYRPEDLRMAVERVARSVRKIRARGGNVVLVRMPTSGETWRLQQTHYPRSLYWDVIARESEALAIHFQDLPEAATLECGDEVHLGWREAITFTKVLAQELRRRGVVP